MGSRTHLGEQLGGKLGGQQDEATAPVKEKNPKRVEQGKRLAEISKAAKEKKKKEREAEVRESAVKEKAEITESSANYGGYVIGVILHLQGL